MNLKESTDGTRKSNLKSFEIYGLFGKRDIVIPFDNNIKILIGENGLGKTSVLNALYYTLKGEFRKLNSIVFDKIVLKFHSGDFVEIYKQDIIFIPDEMRRYGPYEDRIIYTFNRIFSDSEKQRIIDNIKEKKINSKTIERSLTELYDRVRIPPKIINEVLFKKYRGARGKLEELKTKINNEIQEDIYYFPTYRRIEEELHNLGTGDMEEELLKDDTRLIQFGMGDVQDTFDFVLLNIKNSAIQGFSSITGEMLSQYVDGLHESDEEIEPEKLNIILERVGENITDDYKEIIIDLVNSGEIFHEEEKYKYLLNFLSNLIKIYEQQAPADNSIRNFANVCNGYLLDKKVIYDESKVTLSIIQKNDNKEIKLKNLSSGEKQIISLFAKIYLGKPSNLIVLFDEPELSISIEWQTKLLPDILKSNKCNLLLSVTHSPFIFENELDMDAEDVKKYVTEHAN